MIGEQKSWESSVDKIKSKAGGYRQGSGRPKGSGKYKEATCPIRIPESLMPQIQEILGSYAGNKQQSPTVTLNNHDILQPLLESSQSFPLYASSVSAGFPSPADDYIENRLDLNQHLIKHPAATFFVRVAGDSMIGVGIHSGDILVVDRAIKPTDGKVVIAVLNGELTVKRLKVEKSKLSLMPENSNYKPIEITEDMNFNIWGVVTNVIHSL